MTYFEFDLTAKYSPKNALALVRIARLIYSTQEEIFQQAIQWGFNEFSFITTPEPLTAYDTQALVIANSSLIIVAFRGSESRTDWQNNLNFTLIQGYAGRIHELEGRAHQGFTYALDSVWWQVKNTINQFQQQGQTIWFTGHSLGAALATLATARLVLAEDKPVGGLYTFGSPRVGDRVFAKNFNAEFKAQTFRFVNGIDSVTRVPPRQMGYSHVGTFLSLQDQAQISNDIYWWIKFLDTLPAKDTTPEQRLETNRVGASDHDIGLYEAHIEQNIDINPFLLG